MQTVELNGLEVLRVHRRRVELRHSDCGRRFDFDFGLVREYGTIGCCGQVLVTREQLVEMVKEVDEEQARGRASNPTTCRRRVDALRAGQCELSISVSFARVLEVVRARHAAGLSL